MYKLKSYFNSSDELKTIFSELEYLPAILLYFGLVFFALFLMF